MTIAERVRVVPTRTGWLVQILLDVTGAPICRGHHLDQVAAYREAAEARDALHRPHALAHLRRLGAVA